MKKKIINGILLVALLVFATSAFVSCKDNDADSQTELSGKIADLKNQIDNLKKEVGPQGPQGEKGEQGPKGDPGTPGQNGNDGLTPFIGDNGNWWIGTTDTGVKAQGEPGTPGQNGNDGLTPFIGDNGNWWIGTTDTGVKAKGEGSTYDDTAIWAKIDELEDLIDALQDQVDGLNFDNLATQTWVEEQIENIQLQINVLTELIQNLGYTPITGIEINKITNPLFGLDTPLGIESKLLINLYGNAKKDLYFFNPVTGEREGVAPAGKLSNNFAGNIYVTVNPFTTDFSGKIVTLVNTAGQKVPVELSPLQASDAVLTRTEGGLYVISTAIPEDYLDAMEFNYIPEDMEALKESIKSAIKERKKTEIIDLATKIWDIFSSNTFPLYQIEAAWNDGSYKSKADINAVSLKPLSYDFDLADIAEYDDDAVSALESLEEYVVNVSTRTQSTRKRIWNFLNRFNKRIAEPILNNVNWAIQPTLLIQEGENIIHPAVGDDPSLFTRFKAGEITLMPTSWTAEIVAPAYKKFVGVVAIDGQANPEELAAINTGNLGKLIDGNIQQTPLTIEAGHVYQIQYTAIDYFGRVKNLYYNIRGAK